MSKIETDALKFWRAATIIRRAPDRPRLHAKQVLANLLHHTHPAIRDRAKKILKEILK